MPPRDRDVKSRDDDYRRRGDDHMPGVGARFMLQSGDSRLRVICDERETMRACVDAATAMFDKVRSQVAPSVAAAGPSAPSPSAPSPSGVPSR